MKYIKTYETRLSQEYKDRELLKFSKNKASLQQVRKWISVGANVNYSSPTLNTPLHIAAVNGFNSAIKLLINAGANVNAQNNFGETPLMHVVSNLWRFNKRKKTQDLIKFMIEKGADLSIKDTQNRDVFDINKEVDFHEFIMKNFPNEYDIYLIKKDAEKYNL
jgi:ankyrin repeat protein